MVYAHTCIALLAMRVGTLASAVGSIILDHHEHTLFTDNNTAAMAELDACIDACQTIAVGCVGFGSLGTISEFPAFGARLDSLINTADIEVDPAPTIRATLG